MQEKVNTKRISGRRKPAGEDARSSIGRLVLTSAAGFLCPGTGSLRESEAGKK